MFFASSQTKAESRVRTSVSSSDVLWRGHFSSGLLGLQIMFSLPAKLRYPPLGGSFQLEPPYTSRLGHLEEQPSWSLTTYSLGWSSKQGRSPYSTMGKETSWTQKRDMMLVPSREWFPFSWRSLLFQVSGGKKDTNSWGLESLYSRLQVLDLSKSSDDSVWKVGSGDPFWKMSSASFGTWIND